MTNKQINRQFARKQNKYIENILGTSMFVNDVEIFHRHAGQYIYFSCKDDCLNHELRINRAKIIYYFSCV
jgi:hypothetical protein